MISVDLARGLRTAGLQWTPQTGDWFLVDAAELVQERFVLSTMVVDVRTLGSGTVLGFNGTTEWALDSVAVEDTVWLPGEHQLRDHLGDAFVGLTRTNRGWRAELQVAGAPISFTDQDPADAYGRALLHLLTR